MGILLEIISLGGFKYSLSVIPGPEPKAMLFLSAPVAGMLYGVFVIWLGIKIKVKEKMDSEKTSVTERAKLLSTFTKMDYTEKTQLLIAKHIGNLEKEDREQRAKDINQILLKCETREEAERFAESL